MKLALSVFYREPIVFLGSVLAGVAALGTADVVPDWTVLVVIAFVTPIQRYFVTPAE